MNASPSQKVPGPRLPQDSGTENGKSPSPGAILDYHLSRFWSSTSEGHPSPDNEQIAAPRTPSLSIVIPVFNAQFTIERLAEELIRELSPSYRLQLVLVDDGSRDESPAACERLHRRHPVFVDFIQLSRNFGEHNAVMAGLNSVRGDYCVVMDDDFQNPPGEVHKLVDEIQRGRDVVYVRYDAKRHSLLRNVGSRLHNWMATRVLGKPPGLYLSSFKAISRFVVHQAIQYTGPDPYLDAIILQTTRNIGVVTTGHQPRSHGKSGYTPAKLFSLWGNMIVAFSVYPLRLLGLYGLLMTAVGTAFGVYTFSRYFAGPHSVPDSYDRLNATLWFFRGVQLLFISIIGEYIGRIYKQLRREPQFVIRKCSPSVHPAASSSTGENASQGHD